MRLAACFSTEAEPRALLVRHGHNFEAAIPAKAIEIPGRMALPWRYDGLQLSVLWCWVNLRKVQDSKPRHVIRFSQRNLDNSQKCPTYFVQSTAVSASMLAIKSRKLRTL